ncbi:hypothetical protein BABINDRAFT_161530 [Babjeviella inositovora NRRL Y-12698]|uniref:Uncharacterized protein n=1 Tax=Babjeviella inositovora NRRL Y-12698 TaxID=984486 RepID=A0A1E3QQT0_9ASCO|nr:uncharacterized protein BABINDRAFT_161530 [Babjeviella inositovora NRRL Y-12698]ODQ79854.1 hypothetical protein BABINDRAFT_161530 [Babjeviella inositovora NRRL Y-12698]
MFKPSHIVLKPIPRGMSNSTATVPLSHLDVSHKVIYETDTCTEADKVAPVIETSDAVEEVATAEAIDAIDADIAFEEKVPEYLVDIYGAAFPEDEEKKPLYQSDLDMEKKYLLQADLGVEAFSKEATQKARNSTSKATIVIYLMMVISILGMIVSQLSGNMNSTNGVGKATVGAYRSAEVSITSAVHAKAGCRGKKHGGRRGAKGVFRSQVL